MSHGRVSPSDFGCRAAVLSESQNLDSLNDMRKLVLLIVLMYFSATTAGYYIN